MIDHVSVGTHHYSEAVSFYSKVLAPLGVTLQRDTGQEAAFGSEDQWVFFLYPVPSDESAVAKGTHIAFGAASRQVVQEIHALALSVSAKDIFSPRMRPDISATYFGAMFNDLDDHRVEVKTDAFPS
jgi:catechol 2,3-dioxygenase-like lactoylglutathione lyase family enzyme